MEVLTLPRANEIIRTAFDKAADMNLAPLSVAVLDAGGHLKAFQKQDGSSMLRYEIASGKAYGALAIGAGTRWLNRAASERPHFVNAISAMAGGRIIPGPGGVLIRDADNVVVGAVGVSGDTADNDEICAVAGIEALGLLADKG